MASLCCSTRVADTTADYHTTNHIDSAFRRSAFWPLPLVTMVVANKPAIITPIQPNHWLGWMGVMMAGVLLGLQFVSVAGLHAHRSLRVDLYYECDLLSSEG